MASQLFKRPMMKACLLLIALMGLIVVRSAVQAQPVNQSSAFLNLRRYVTSVRLNGQPRQEIGVLFAVTDSTLVLAPIKGLKSTMRLVVNQHGGTLPTLDSLGYFVPLRTYKYSQINELSLRRRGHALKGMLLGIGVGMIVGLVQGDDPPSWFRFSAGDKAIIFGILFAPLGSLGSLFSIKNVDAKRQSIATEMQGRLRKYAIVEQLRKANYYKP
jgi:hypothetical protein